jgi:hypothetical protein
MGIRKGTVKGLVAVTSGLVAQLSGAVPRLVLQGQLTPIGDYLGFVVGTFLGLVAADILTGDVRPGRPVLGALKGLSGALGAGIPLVLFADFGPFVTVCGTGAGDTIENVVGAGLCHDYLKMVTGTFLGVLVGDILLGPYETLRHWLRRSKTGSGNRSRRNR